MSNAVLEQFLVESRDFLQTIGERILQLEKSPGSAELMDDLFRAVHTLKGNCGLFDFPEMGRVLHAAEDVMTAVREQHLGYGQAVADRLLDGMDLVATLLDEIEELGHCDAAHAGRSAALAAALRALLAPAESAAPSLQTAPAALAEGPLTSAAVIAADEAAALLASFDAASRAACAAVLAQGGRLRQVRYEPEPECFFKGEDPFHQARQLPGLLAMKIDAAAPWPDGEVDIYRCNLRFEMLSCAGADELLEHFRYVPEQVAIADFDMPAPHPEHAPSRSAEADAVIAAQLQILSLPDQVAWLAGRLRAVAAVLTALCRTLFGLHHLQPLQSALDESLAQNSSAPLRDWLGQRQAELAPATTADAPRLPDGTAPPVPATAAAPLAPPAAGEAAALKKGDEPAGARTLKVEQARIDHLMNLIGEMVVAKNGLPYLATRAETVFGTRELAREIKAQYDAINRISGEMQDAIMRVRMMPVSFIFQRFPRLVRDLSRKLGKDVALVLEGEDTEADKNVIEALADPLIHIVRNSLDHGLETPAQRIAAGKDADGKLIIRASQEGDRVLIEIIDDGKGIDPEAVKRKAVEKGLVSSDVAARMGAQEAVNLVFAAGFSTAEAVSDLSGRGVGMDVVRATVERLSGSVSIDSRPGEGTRIALSLPLSMAVTSVMIIESGSQLYGVPMDAVVETVRVPRQRVTRIRHSDATVLRDRLVPLRPLNDLLATGVAQQLNEDDEAAVLVTRHQDELVGIVVDDFREVADIILKPMSGFLSGLSGYAGSALLGDGTVLMVLNTKELLACP